MHVVGGRLHDGRCSGRGLNGAAGHAGTTGRAGNGGGTVGTPSHDHGFDGGEEEWHGVLTAFGGGSGRPRLVRGREPLWRSRGCVQLGLDPRHAIAVDGLSPALARLVSGLDGSRTARRLVADAAAAGADPAEAAGLLAELAAAGLIEDAELAGSVPDELAADAQAWHARTGCAGRELVSRRSTATVEVHGNGRVAIAVAVLLTAAGVGGVLARPSGRVAPGDVGVGYLGEDIGRPRVGVAAAAIDRHRVAGARPAGPHAADGGAGGADAGARGAAGGDADASATGADGGDADVRGAAGGDADARGAAGGDAVIRRRTRAVLPDVAVVADAAVHDAGLAARLVSERVPHLAVRVQDGRAIVGPLVLPGRTGCLRCVDLHRSDRDPCWPRLAAQLAGRPTSASHAGASVAAGVATEQVLGLLAGSGRPAAIGASLELDPLSGRLVREPWPAHPACGCGAAPGQGLVSRNTPVELSGR